MIRLEIPIEFKFVNSSCSGSHLSVRVSRACPPGKQLLVEQFEASRAIRGGSISVSSISLSLRRGHRRGPEAGHRRGSRHASAVSAPLRGGRGAARSAAAEPPAGQGGPEDNAGVQRKGKCS